MTASLLLPIGVLFSMAAGIILILLVIFSGSRSQTPRKRWPIIAAFFAAGLINSWWMAVVVLVFIKLFVLREDT